MATILRFDRALLKPRRRMPVRPGTCTIIPFLGIRREQLGTAAKKPAAIDAGPEKPASR